jgi:S-adenosyl-L-methionine hydrolase (adenosine-forming)
VGAVRAGFLGAGSVGCVPDRPPFVSFLSDYGRADEFVGVCHAVMLDIAPDLRIVDVTHEIPPFDVRAGALALVRAIQYLPEGVVLAVVDPGVGTDRRCLAVEVENAALVGPDNGLLAPAVAMLGGPRRVVEITAGEYQLAAPGPTFAGRDVMAPAAAYLASGLPLEALGPDVDPARLTPALVPLPNDDGEGRIVGEVLWVDHYGNCQLNVAPEQLEAAGAHRGDAFEITVHDAMGVAVERRARWVDTFAEAKPSELVVLVDSYGMCTLALDRRSAAQELGMRAASAVTLATEGAAPPAAAPGGVPIGLGRREPRP